MGLFDKIKKIIDNPEIATNQTANATEKAIITLRQKPLVNRNPLLLRLLTECGNLQQINVGLGNYKKEELLFKFNINDPNEEVILYLCGRLGLFGKIEPLFLVTNTSVYFKEADSPSSKRYSFLDLTRYILLSSEDGGDIRLVNEKTDDIIYAKGILKKHLSQNSDIFSITKVMSIIQTEMADKNSNARENRTDLFKWLHKKVDKDLRSKGLGIFEEKLIKNLRTEKPLETICNLLLLKGYLYKQDHPSLLNTLLATSSTPEDEQDILDRYEEIILKYVNELKDFSVEFSDECLTDAFLSKNDTSFDYQMISLIENDTSSNLQKKMLDIYKKYNEDIDYYNTIRKDVQIPIEFILWSCNARGVESKKKREYITDYLLQLNKSMTAVFDKIRSGGLPEKRQLDWCDGQGLTALHYAMISNNRDAIEFCIKHMSFKESLLDDDNDELINIQLYGVVALLTGMGNYFEALMDKADEVAPLLKTKNALTKQKKALYTIYKATNMMVSTAKKQLEYAIKEGQTSQEQIEQQRYNIDKTLMHLERIEENIQELDCQIEATDDDINAVKSLLKKRCEEIAEYARNISVSFGRYFYFLYLDAGLLEKILDSTLDNLKLYEHNGKFIFIDPSIGNFKFEKRYQAGQNKKNAYENSSSKSKEKKKDGFQKPYVDSWFSENAHNDLKQLTKEYHKLVFQYHPDNDPEMLEAFLSIQNERAEILDTLEYQK